MQIKRGVSVYTKDNREIGQVERVVIDPKTQEISALVVQRGVLFTDDKVLPLDWIAETSEDQLMLEVDVDLDRLPDFESKQYILLRPEDWASSYSAGDAIPLYWYPPYGFAPIGESAYGPQIVETEENIPEGTIPLEEGADVLSADGNQVGKIAEILTTPGSDRVSHFVIAGGRLSGKRLIPAIWVKVIDEEKIQLIIKTKLLEKLPDYQK